MIYILLSWYKICHIVIWDFGHIAPPPTWAVFVMWMLLWCLLTRWCVAGSLLPCSPKRSCSGPVWTWRCRRPSDTRPASPHNPERLRRESWVRPDRSLYHSPHSCNPACSPSSAYRSASWRVQREVTVTEQLELTTELYRTVLKINIWFSYNTHFFKT